MRPEIKDIQIPFKRLPKYTTLILKIKKLDHKKIHHKNVNNKILFKKEI